MAVGWHMVLFLYAHTRHLCVRAHFYPRDRQIDSQRRREASSKEIRSRAREGKKKRSKQEMRCEGNAGTANSNTLETSTGPGQKHIITIISLPQSIVHPTSPHQLVLIWELLSCVFAFLLFAPSACILCDLVAAAFAGSRLLLLSGCFP